MVHRKRDAEALESLLSGDARASAAAAREQLRPLLAVATAVRQLPGATATATAPSADFREQLRLRVMAEAEGLAAARAAAARTRTPARPPGRRLGPLAAGVPLSGRRARIAGALTASVLVGGAAAAVVSTTAVPGDALYPVKRGIEDVRLATAATDAARGDTALSLARERLDEAEVLATDGSAGSQSMSPETVEHVTETLVAFDEQAGEGMRLLLEEYGRDGDPAHLADVDTFVKEALPRLERLREEVPASLAPLVDDLIDRLAQLAQEVDSTAAACGPTCTNLGIGGAFVDARQPERDVDDDDARRAWARAGAGAGGSAIGALVDEPLPSPQPTAAAGGTEGSHDGGSAPDGGGGDTGGDAPLAPVADGVTVDDGVSVVEPAPGLVTSVPVLPGTDPEPAPAPLPAPLPAPSVTSTLVPLPGTSLGDGETCVPVTDVCTGG